MDTQELIIQSNNLLLALNQNSTVHWRNEIRNIYGAQGGAAENAIKSILDFCQKNPVPNEEYGLRFIQSSSGNIGERFLTNILLQSERNKIIATLKEKKRIIQVGSGRGKGFAIISSKYLEEEITDEHDNFIDPNDHVALLKAISVSVVDQVEDLKALQIVITDKNHKIRQQQETINHLQDQVATTLQRSWY